MKIAIHEIIIFMLVYGSLFLYGLRLISSKQKTFVYLKSSFLIVLYVFTCTLIWFMYKAEEFHMNAHNGYESISFTSEAIVMIVSLSIYSVILLLLGIRLKRLKGANSEQALRG